MRFAFDPAFTPTMTARSYKLPLLRVQTANKANTSCLPTIAKSLKESLYQQSVQNVKAWPPHKRETFYIILKLMNHSTQKYWHWAARMYI